MKAALITSCPEIGRSLELLMAHLGQEVRPNRCPTTEDPRDLVAELHEMLAGNLIAIVGIGGISEDVMIAVRTLEVASRTRQCVIVLTASAYPAFIREFEAMSAVKLGFVSSRVAAAILVGDTGKSFVGFNALFPTTKVHDIGGLGWASTSCAKIAEHIVAATTRKPM